MRRRYIRPGPDENPRAGSLWPWSPERATPTTEAAAKPSPAAKAPTRIAPAPHVSVRVPATTEAARIATRTVSTTAQSAPSLLLRSMVNAAPLLCAYRPSPAGRWLAPQFGSSHNTPRGSSVGLVRARRPESPLDPCAAGVRHLVATGCLRSAGTIEPQSTLNSLISLASFPCEPTRAPSPRCASS